MSKSAVDQVLKDPDNHYPYNRDAALEAGIPPELVDASEAVVNAQEAYLRDPSDKNLEARNDAEREAQRVSRAHRGGPAQDSPAPSTVEGKSN
jgi:hypothetical protein